MGSQMASVDSVSIMLACEHRSSVSRRCAYLQNLTTPRARVCTRFTAQIIVNHVGNTSALLCKKINMISFRCTLIRRRDDPVGGY